MSHWMCARRRRPSPVNVVEKVPRLWGDKIPSISQLIRVEVRTLLFVDKVQAVGNDIGHPGADCALEKQQRLQAL